MESEQDLLKKIKSHSKDSVEKCKDILKLAKALADSNPVESVKWCIKGIEISKRIGYADGACFNDSIGIANVWAGNFLDALKYFNIALQYYEQKLSTNLKQEEEEFTQLNASKVKNNIAVVYENLCLMQEALKIHEANLEYYIKGNFKRDALLSFLNISSVYINDHQYEQGLKALDKFFLYYKKYKLEEPSLLGMAYVNRLLAKEGLLPHNKQTVNDYFKAIELFKSVKNIRLTRLVYIDLAAHYESIGQYSKMIEYANKAIEITQQTNLNERQDGVYNMLYTHYKKVKDLENAFQYLELLNREKEAKKKQEAMASLAKQKIHEQLNKKKSVSKTDNTNTTYFHNSDAITISQSKIVYDVKVLDITSVEVDNSGFASVNTVQGNTYKTTMPFTSVMAKVESTSHKQHFFYTNKRKQAINLIYKKEINKQKRTITLEFLGNKKTLPFTVRQYYELLKLEKS